MEAILIHNGNMKPSILTGRVVNCKETYEVFQMENQKTNFHGSENTLMQDKDFEKLLSIKQKMLGNPLK